MATKLYALVAPATTHQGGANSFPALWGGGNAFVNSYALGLSPGASVQQTALENTASLYCYIGASSGGQGGQAMEWISEPLSANFTISGTITFNIWAYESSMSANIGARCVIDRINAAGAVVSTIVASSKGVEYGTSFAVQNWTATPTSTAFVRGDRIRVMFGFDDAGGTHVGGFQTGMTFNGATGGVSGDSWVQFTENLTFEPAGDPTFLVNQATQTTTSNFGFTSGNLGVQFAQPFVAQGSLVKVSAWLLKNATPTDNVVVEIQSDSGGNPSGTVIASMGTISMSTLTTSPVQYFFTANAALVSGTTYHIVFRRDGTLSNTSCPGIGVAGSVVSGWLSSKAYNGTSWSTLSGSTGTAAVGLFFAPSTYYLTDTAETINPGSATEKKALTTRGSGSVNGVTNTSAGPVTPFQITATGGGAAIEWYTPPLNAVTFGGKAKFNIRALESSASADSSLKAEIAVCAGDGSSPVVWGAANVEAIMTYGLSGELNTTDTTTVAWVSGGDTSITTGQRLRFRIYVDDCGDSTLASGFTVTVSYNGITAAAAGDTFVILPVLVTEASTTTPVTKTLALSYNVVGRISKTVTPAYNVKKTISKTVVPAYNVIGRITKTLALSYYVGIKPYSAVILGDGPTGYWRMEESGLPQDLSGSGNHMTSDTGTTAQVTGLLANYPTSKARGFSAAGTSFLYSGAIYALNTFSVEMWVKRTRTTTQEVLLDQYNGGFTIVINSDGTIALNKSFVGTCAQTSTLKILDTNTHHIVVTRNGVGGAVTFYLDGVPETPTPTNPSYDFSTPATTGLFIGSEWGNSPFDGTLDEVAIYPTVLSYAKVSNHYAVGKLAGYEYAVRNDAPIAYFRLGESSGTVAVNEVGSPGTYSGSPTLGVTGKISGNTAVFFDGIDDQVAIPVATPVGSSITVEFWNYVTTANATSGTPGAFGLGGNAPDRIMAHAPYVDKVIYWFYGDNGDTPSGSRVWIDYTAYLDQWTLVQLTFDAATNKHAISLNGVEVASGISTSKPTISFSSGNIGVDTGTWRHHGAIDEFAVYNYALTPTQRLAHFNATVLPSVSKTIALNYNVKATVAKTLALSYNVKAQISKTITPAYIVKKAITQTVTPAYNVKKQIAKTQAFSYNVKVVVTKTIAPAYNVKKSIVQTITPSYNVKKAIVKTVTPAYNVIQRIVKTLSLSYNVASGATSPVLKTSTFSYNVKKLVSQTVTPAYNVKRQIAKTSTFSYNVKVVVAKTVTPTYNVIGRITKTITPVYNVKKSIAKTSTFSYNVIGRITVKTLSLTYNVRKLVVQTAALTYNVKRIVAQTITPTYNVKRQIAKTVAPAYNIVGRITKTVTPTYNVNKQIVKTQQFTYNLLSLGAVSKQQTFSYNIRVQLVKTVALNYFVRTTVAVKTITPSYTVRKAIVKTVAPAYNVRVVVTKALSPNYFVRVIVSKTVTPVYNVKRQIPKTQTFSYNVVSLTGVGKSLALSYNVRKLVTVTYSASYLVKRAIVKTLTPTYNVKRQIIGSATFSYNVRKLVLKTSTFSYNVTKANVTKTFTASYLIRVKVTKTVTPTYLVRVSVVRIRLYSYNIKQGIVKPYTLAYRVRAYLRKDLLLVYSVGSATISPTGKLAVVQPARGYTTVTVNGHTNTEVQPANGYTTISSIDSSLNVR